MFVHADHRGSNHCRKIQPHYGSYLLTPWSRVLLEKVTVFQLVKKFPAFYGTRRFITACTSARHLSLSWASSIRSIPTSHFLKIHLNIILSSMPGTPKWYLSLRFTHQNLYTPLLSPTRATYAAHLILLDLISQKILGEQYWSLSSSLCSFLHSHVTSSLLGPNILLSTLFSNTLSLRSSLSVTTKFHTHAKQQVKL